MSDKPEEVKTEETVVTPDPEIVTALIETKPKRATKERRKTKRPGKMSNEKGGRWERSVGKQLSLWITKGERGDIFRRNILSGGRFTVETGKASKEPGLPGDIAIAHPLAAGFVGAFCVEAKHVRDVNLMPYLLGDGSPFLKKVVDKVRQEAMSAGDLDWMVIAKQNRMPTMLLTSMEVGICAKIESKPFYHHLLFLPGSEGNSLFLANFDSFIECVDAEAFLTRLRIVPEHEPTRVVRRPIAQHGNGITGSVTSLPRRPLSGATA
jgi:hypothetical protein